MSGLGRVVAGVVAGVVLAIACAAWGQSAPETGWWTSPDVTPVGIPVPREQTHIPIDFIHVPQLTGPVVRVRVLVERDIIPPDMKKNPPGERGTGRTAPLPQHFEGMWEEKPWIAWWETNRDAVLRQVATRVPAGQAAAAKLSDAQRTRAVEVLTRATHSEHTALRAYAALALGQMREAKALARLKELTADSESQVRGAAWVAIGLCGAAESEAALVGAHPRDLYEALGVVTGLGMLDRPGSAAFDLLYNIARGANVPDLRRTAVWAIRAQHRAQDHAFVRELLASGVTRAIANEGVLALGAIGDGGDADGLIDLVSAGSAAPAGLQQAAGSTGTANQPANPTPGGARQAVAVQAPPVSSGLNGLLRGSAATALAYPGSSRPLAAGNPRALNALLANFTPFMNQGGPNYSGASLLAFAMSAGPQDMYILRDILDMSPDPMFAGVNPRSTLRGYAALGIGLYLAKGGSPLVPSRSALLVDGGSSTGLPDNWDLNEILAKRYANTSDYEDVRAACALALGLSGDPANARRLLDGAEQISRGNTLLLGYTVLAMGLLHEKALLNAAGPLLAGSTTRIPVDSVAARGLPGGSITEPASVPQDGPAVAQILARRAAFLGVALLGDQRAGAMLAGAWGKDRYTVQDAGRAIGWCNAAAAIDSLLELVKRDQKGAVEAAVSLGWAFEPDRPSRLSRLVIGNNYHLPTVDYDERLAGSELMFRDYPRLGDFFLYSSTLGGKLVARVRP